MLKTIFSGALLNFWLFIFFMCGIILGNQFPYFLVFFALFFISAGLVYFFYQKNKLILSDIFILILFLSLGASWQIPYSRQKIEQFLGQETTYILKVASLPQGQGLRNIFFAELIKANNIHIKQRIKVIDYTKSMDYLNRYGVKAKLTKRKYGRSDFYSLWVKANSLPKELPSNIWDRFSKKTASVLISIFRDNLNDTAYRFLASVFLGRRELLTKDEAGIFKDAGIAHLLAISGSHIALVAIILFFLLKLFYFRFRPCLVISLAFLFIYTFIVGLNPPTLRAAIMYSIFAAGYFVKRKINPFNSLGIAGLVCLMSNPSWLFDAGFQLSFLSVFALIMGFAAFPLKFSKITLVSYLQYLFFSSCLVSLFITPLVSYYFGRIYLFTLFYNIILIPFFSLILMINFLLIIFSPLPFIAQAIGSVISTCIYLFYNLSQSLGSFKFSFAVYAFSTPLVFTYYFLLGTILILTHPLLYPRLRREASRQASTESMGY